MLSKVNQIKILQETVQTLGVDSYCGAWLHDMIEPLRDCIETDNEPKVYFSDARYVKMSQIQRHFIISIANEEAESTIANARRRAKYECIEILRKAQENIQQERRVLIDVIDKAMADVDYVWED